jgi:GT2 family glycosyltransferase
MGGFDEHFFMFCEDVDLCLRLHQAGWKNYYVPWALATHKIASSTSQRMARMTLEWHKSMYRFYRKHYAAAHSLPWRALAVTGIGVRCAAGLAKAWWHGLGGR